MSDVAAWNRSRGRRTRFVRLHATSASAVAMSFSMVQEQDGVFSGQPTSARLSMGPLMVEDLCAVSRWSRRSRGWSS